MKTVIVAALVSAGTSIMTAAFVTFLGCCAFKIYVDKTMDRIGDEMIRIVKESIRDAHPDK
ncbi:MAG: hypothetical protein NC331_11495 [Lachnospiraceae bacterium]|nr:hypothetical protein [Lachnospiraceae bacterium]MCM1239992.1 hypothetical protein [Lachnospiraceae bacterium]